MSRASYTFHFVDSPDLSPGVLDLLEDAQKRYRPVDGRYRRADGTDVEFTDYRVVKVDPVLRNVHFAYARA